MNQKTAEGSQRGRRGQSVAREVFEGRRAIRSTGEKWRRREVVFEVTELYGVPEERTESEKVYWRHCTATGDHERKQLSVKWPWTVCSICGRTKILPVWCEAASEKDDETWMAGRDLGKCEENIEIRGTGQDWVAAEERKKKLEWREKEVGRVNRYVKEWEKLLSGNKR